MRRRDFLAALSGGGICVGSGGCLSANGAESSKTTTGGRKLPAQISLNNQDTIPDRHKLQIDVEILEREITERHTARLQITINNSGSTRALSIGNDGCELFNRQNGGSSQPAGLWLYTPEVAERIEREENRWVLAPSARPREFPGYGCHPTTYESGESISNEYVVWDDYDVDGYLVPDTYRWEEEVSIWDSAQGADQNPSDTSIVWGFSIQLEY